MDLVEEDDRERLADLQQRVRRADGDGSLEVEVRLRRADGSLEWLAIRQSVFTRDDTGTPTHILGSASIVTHRKRAEERMREHVLALNRTQAELQIRQAELEKVNHRLQQLARKDGLTDVYNHRAFQERLAEEVSRARRSGHPLSLLLGDVDDFKAYNDRYGHVEGDDRLRFFGQVLQSCTRPSDFVARYGGEEFAVILPETRLEQGAIVAERILSMLGQEEGHRRITASFGLVQLAEEHVSASSLIAAADKALYFAKSSGKNQVAMAPSGLRLG
jgi:diguanylate cyclase (GGDEF)-like protein